MGGPPVEKRSRRAERLPNADGRTQNRSGKSRIPAGNVGSSPLRGRLPCSRALAAGPAVRPRDRLGEFAPGRRSRCGMAPTASGTRRPCLDWEGDVRRVCRDAPAPVVDSPVEQARAGGAALAALAGAAGARVTLVTALSADGDGTPAGRPTGRRWHRRGRRAEAGQAPPAV